MAIFVIILILLFLKLIFFIPHYMRTSPRLCFKPAKKPPVTWWFFIIFKIYFATAISFRSTLPFSSIFKTITSTVSPILTTSSTFSTL